MAAYESRMRERWKDRDDERIDRMHERAENLRLKEMKENNYGEEKSKNNG